MGASMWKKNGPKNQWFKPVVSKNEWMKPVVVNFYKMVINFFITSDLFSLTTGLNGWFLDEPIYLLWTMFRQDTVAGSVIQAYTVP